MKKIFLVALVAVTLFSCSKENSEAPEGGETKNVTLIIKSAKSVDSRTAEEAGKAHETPINDFTVYFLSSNGGVVDSRTVTTIGTDPYKFDGVSGLTSKVYIVANTTLTGTDIGGSTLDALKMNTLNITKYQAGIDKVVMSGEASAITEKQGEEGEYTATVTIAPVVARLEIAKLTAISASDPTKSDITAFTVDNIYVNGYSATMTLGGTASAPITGTKNNFAETSLKDEDINITATDKIAVPAAPNAVWAYQLFPGSAHTMVIQFSSISFANGDILTNQNTDPKDLCVTVTAFTPEDFAAANIYHVDNIEFSTSNIGQPYETTKNISVALSVTPWAIQGTTVTLQ